MFYIVDANGYPMRDARDEEFVEETIEKCHQVISYYFDMDYGDIFTIVNAQTFTTVEVVEREVWEDAEITE